MNYVRMIMFESYHYSNIYVESLDFQSKCGCSIIKIYSKRLLYEGLHARSAVYECPVIFKVLYVRQAIGDYTIALQADKLKILYRENYCFQTKEFENTSCYTLK